MVNLHGSSLMQLPNTTGLLWPVRSSVLFAIPLQYCIQTWSLQPERCCHSPLKSLLLGMNDNVMKSTEKDLAYAL